MNKRSSPQLKMVRPSKPLLIFDGDCHFCRYWVARWRHQTGQRVDYEPYQDKSVQITEIPLKDFQSSVQLILPTGEVYGGAEAVFRTLHSGAARKWPLWLYEHVPVFRYLTEWAYSLVARHRTFFSRLTRIFWGTEIQAGDHFIARWFFLRALGVIYGIAFLSLLGQVTGLIGSDGILPAQPFLEAVKERTGAQSYTLLPTVFWFGAGDQILRGVCMAGAVLSGLLVVGIAPSLILLVLWGLYLSLFSVSRVFLGYQWDILLLEVGFLAIFLAPLQWKPKLANEAPPSKGVLFLFHFLFFKLMLSAGLVKWLSGDKTWRDLTALNFHYETQPIPTWTSWYAHQVPGWFQKTSVAGVFWIEVLFPILVFAPRRLRYFGCLSQIVLQVLIMATGNYGFFNLLAIALALLLLDDTAWPRPFRKWVEKKRNWSPDFPSMKWPKIIITPLVVLILFLTLVHWPSRLRLSIPWPKPVLRAAQYFLPFHLVNNYGLFAVMTTRRPEIILEGSRDGRAWEAYEFKYKPGDVSRRPVFVAPHMPRLDWQMWFASLGTVRQNPWFVNFCMRLLQGSKPVLDLMERNPFPDSPPRYLRAMMYDYHFTDFKERKNTRQWWTYDKKQTYLPAISLQNFQHE